jgi:hypothetical protein
MKNVGISNTKTKMTPEAAERRRTGLKVALGEPARRGTDKT